MIIKTLRVGVNLTICGSVLNSYKSMPSCFQGNAGISAKKAVTDSQGKRVQMHLFKSRI